MRRKSRDEDFEYCRTFQTIVGAKPKPNFLATTFFFFAEHIFLMPKNLILLEILFFI